MSGAPSLLPRDVVLVTGPPRSGTTAVGSILSSGPGCVSLHEPMNYHTGDKCIERYFEVPADAAFTDADFEDLVQRIARCRLKLKRGEFPGEKRWRRTAKMVTGGRTTLSQRLARLHLRRSTVIWKDPFAAFCVDKLLDFDNVKVVVCYRGPNELAASFKRVGWAYSHYAIQDRIDPEFHIMPVGSESSGGAELEHAQRGALFWAQSYNYLWQQAQRSDRIRFVNIANVTQDPTEEYRRLFAFCELEFGERTKHLVAKRYQQAARPDRAMPRSDQTHVRNRDTSTINTYWKELLTENELEFSSRHCSDLATVIVGSDVFV